MSQSITLNSQNRYEIIIQGQSDDSWLGWFGEVEVHSATLADDTQVTTFSNVVMDQAGLVGLIRRLHGLGIVLLSIQIADCRSRPPALVSDQNSSVASLCLCSH